MVFFRVSLFEFNEGMNSRLHALRRHYWSGLFWRFFQPFITACILIIGYVMELVIAGHAPEGDICPVRGEEKNLLTIICIDSGVVSVALNRVVLPTS